jgi:hypothetical protein
MEKLAVGLALSYSDAKNGEVAQVRLFSEGAEREASASTPAKSEFQPLMI